MEKKTIRLGGIILILTLWFLVFITFFYVLDRIQKHDRITTYFDEIEKSQSDTPQHIPQWEEAHINGSYTKTYNLLRPGYEQLFDGLLVKLKPTYVKINSDGFRDREFSLEKPQNTFRIIMLGDSFVFGWGVELNDSLSKQLESILNERQDNLNYEVLNLGLGGDTFDEITSFKAIGLKYNPDLAILCFSPSDMDNESFKTEKAKEIMEEYKAKGVVISQIELKHKVFDLMQLKSFDERWPGIENPLNDLTSILENKNTKLIIYSFIGSKTEHVNRKLANFANEHPKVYFEIADATNLPINDLILHPLDPHPTPLAYKLHAEKIYETLIKQNLIPSD